MPILTHTRRLAQTMAAALILGLLPAVSACNSPGDPFGQILSDLSSQVQDVITKAGQTANGTLLTAAGAVQQDIDATASAFGDVLTKGINQVDAAAKSDLDQISAYTQQLNSQIQSTVGKTADQASALLVQIGIGANLPIVKGYGPHFTTAAQAADGLDLHLHGVFPRADQPGYRPTLKVNGTAQPPSALTSNDLTDLTFRLPPQTFPDAVAGITPPRIEVDIPYAKGHIFKSVVPGTFHIQIATLPDSPIKSMTLTKTVPGKSTSIPHQFQSDDVFLNSLDCHDHSYYLPIPAKEAGWTFDPTSVHAVIQSPYPKGPDGTVDTPQATVSPSRTELVLQAATRAACGFLKDEGGRILFHFTFVEDEPASSPSTIETTALTLDWGKQSRVVVPQSPGTWQVEVVLWNGVTLDAPTMTNPWVKLRDLGTYLAYSAVDLDSVDISTVYPTS